MAEFGFATDPFAEQLQQQTPDRSHKSTSRSSKDRERTSKTGSSSREKDRTDRNSSNNNKDRERRHRSSDNKDRDKELHDRSGDRHAHKSSSTSRDKAPRTLARKSDSFHADFDAFGNTSTNTTKNHHHNHHRNSNNNNNDTGHASNERNSFGYETHQPSVASTSVSTAPVAAPESRMRRMRRASVIGSSAGSSTSSGGSAGGDDVPAAGRVRRQRRASLVGDLTTSNGVAGSSSSRRQILQGTRSSDGLEDMRHGVRTGMPEGHNVAQQPRRGRRASMAAVVGGHSADYGYRDGSGSFRSFGGDEEAPMAKQVFLDERANRQRKLLDKFRNMDLDDEASVVSPKKDTHIPAVSAVRADLMLQSTEKEKRPRRRTSLIGALSGVVGGGGGAGAAARGEVKEEEKKVRRAGRSKSASGDILMGGQDLSRARMRDGGLLDRVSAGSGRFSSTDREASKATGSNYSDRILQGR